MARRIKKSPLMIVTSAAWTRLFTVPAGKKYELLGCSITAGAAGATNIAGLHVFAGGPAAALNFNEQIAAATGSMKTVVCNAEPFEATDAFDVIWAPGAGNGQGYCWYVEVDV